MIRLCCFSFTDEPDKLSEGSIDFVYDAAGIKVSKHVSKKGLQKTYVDKNTFYGGNFIYKGAANAKELVFFNHAEGYVEPKSGSFAYIYQYKDHLGNIRLAYSDENKNGTITPDEIKEENNYYPFGLKHKGYNEDIKGRDHKYGFGGKEYQDELGLEWYDVSARNYNAALGRWMNIDPLAEKMRRHSPFNYAFNNPIFFIDYDGMAPDPIYNIKGKLIGDDGKNDSKIHIAYNKEQAESIETETEGGNKAIDLTGKDVVTLHGGEATVKGVVASVDAEESDTSEGAGDKGLHEEGGHTQRDSDGNVSIVAWKAGDKKTGTDNATVTPFNGVSKPNTSELADYWHVHTSGGIEGINKNGDPTVTKSVPGPSGGVGAPKKGDIDYQKGLESAGYNTTAIQVDTRHAMRVNFYTGSSTNTKKGGKNYVKMNYKKFKKLIKKK